jgi:hypothetical protein
MSPPFCAPRQKLPPPTTSASSTPLAWAVRISAASEAVASGATPKPRSPARNSPGELQQDAPHGLLPDGDAAKRPTWTFSPSVATASLRRCSTVILSSLM